MSIFASEIIKENEGAFSQESDRLNMSFDICEILKECMMLIINGLCFGAAPNFKICDEKI
jgi:hypothetical protein